MKALSETRILSLEEAGRSGRKVRLAMKLAGLPERFTPGETVLFQSGGRCAPQCSRAVVVSCSAQATTIVAAIDEDDPSPAAGDGLTVWSSLDEVVRVSTGSLIVTTRPFLYRIEPYAALGAEIMLDAGDETLWNALRSRFADASDWSACFLALPPGRLRAFRREFPQADPNAFVNLAMSCGIGACRSCHANLVDNKQGEPTCVRGPWFPLRRLDLEKLQPASLPFD